MTATAEPLSCERCHRRVVQTPVWWFGKAYGTTCAKRYGLSPEKRIRVKAPKRDDEMEQPVLDGLEDNEKRGVIDMTETTTTDRPLPYGGTVAELRQMIARHAQHGEMGWHSALDNGPGVRPKVTFELQGADLDNALTAHYAANYGYSVAALLRWLGETFGPDAAWTAAAIVQDLGENGGNDLLDDITVPAEAAQESESER